LYFRGQINFGRKLVALFCSQIRQSPPLRAKLIHDDDNEDISKQSRSISGEVPDASIPHGTEKVVQRQTNKGKRNADAKRMYQSAQSQGQEIE
jgi:hypothetical protein